MNNNIMFFQSVVNVSTHTGARAQGRQAKPMRFSNEAGIKSQLDTVATPGLPIPPPHTHAPATNRCSQHLILQHKQWGQCWDSLHPQHDTIS